MPLEGLPQITQRKSILVFTKQNLTAEQISLLLKAAQWAPSCFNKQEWRFTLVRRESPTRNGLEAALNRGNAWAKEAPLLVVISANPAESCMSFRDYYAYDAGLAVMSLVLQAEYLGLRVHQMAGWNESKVKLALSIPDSQKVLSIAAIGYEETDADRLAQIAKTDERMGEKIKRASIRTRVPLREIAFDGVYGQSYEK